MAKKTPVDKMAEAIGDILADYNGDVINNVAEITKAMGQKGVQALKRASKESFGGSGDYSRGWTVDVNQGRVGTAVTIYNKTPGLPHLLEHGHVTRNGTGREYGSVPGREHIAPIEAELVETYQREVASKL